MKTKQYMQFDEFKVQLFEAIDSDDKAAWMGSIMWHMLDSGDLYIYYAVYAKNDPAIVSAFDGELQKECIKLYQAVNISTVPAFTKVTDSFKYNKEYTLYLSHGNLDPKTNDLKDAKKRLSKEIGEFIQLKKTYTGFELNDKTVKVDKFENENDVQQGAYKGIARMVENRDSFGGWDRVKEHFKKITNMPAKDFFIEYGDNFLTALSFFVISRSIKNIAKMVKKNKKGGSNPTPPPTPPPSGGPAPEWKDTNPVETDMSVGATESVNLNDYVNHADNAYFLEHHYGSATVSIDFSNRLSVSGITMPMEFVVTVKLKNATDDSEIGEKEFKFNVT